MKTNVEIMSRKAMNILIESGFPKNTAVISFYDPKDGRGGPVFSLLLFIIRVETALRWLVNLSLAKSQSGLTKFNILRVHSDFGLLFRLGTLFVMRKFHGLFNKIR